MSEQQRHQRKEGMSFFGITLLAFFVGLVMKVYGLLDNLDWIWIIAPLWIAFGVTMVGSLFGFVVTIINSFIIQKRQRESAKQLLDALQLLSIIRERKK